MKRPDSHKPLGMKAGPIRRPIVRPIAEIVAVGARHELLQMIGTANANALISISDFDDSVPRPPQIDENYHLQLAFADTKDPKHPHAPTEAHIEQAARFLMGLDPERRVVLHCVGGISRSTAMALGLRCLSDTCESAERWLLALKPRARPNALLAELWDQYLGLDSELIKAAARLRER